MQVAGVDPEEILITEESEKSVLRRLNALLSVFEKQVLSEYLQNRSYEEIAQTLSTTKKSVDNAVQRIRQKLNRIKP